MPADNQRALADSGPLSLFELPQFLVRPAVMACRGFNNVVDALFYDLPTLEAGLRRGEAVARALGEPEPTQSVSFDALIDPEGCLLLIDAGEPPYVRKFSRVDDFLNSELAEARRVEVATITGVGSSALGSAAMGWDVSAALGAPVLAIVPGYGVADMILQALGGWFGFGLHDFLDAKSVTQTALANVAPEAAKIGRRLSASAPGAETLHGAPVFRYGSGSSDVLHALLRERARPFRLLVGHSKGALQIANALRSVEEERFAGLRVVTLGCPVASEARGVTYRQYLGLFDALGQLNAWGHWPDVWTPTGHSTNPDVPLAMAAGALASESD
jgi:hypothetical protein